MAENSNAQTRRLGNYDIASVLEPARYRDYWWIARQREETTRAHFDEAKNNLDSCDFVGVQERFESDVRELLRALDLTTPSSLPRVNETIGRPPLSAVDSATFDLIMERNLLDFELYRYVCKHRRRLSDDPNDWQEVAAGMNLARAELLYAGAAFELNGALRVRTAALPWSYAVALSPGTECFNGPALVELDFELVRGTFQIGFLNRDLTEIAAGQIIESGPGRHTVRLVTDDLAKYDRIILRNGRHAEVSEALVHDARLYRC